MKLSPIEKLDIILRIFPSDTAIEFKTIQDHIKLNNIEITPQESKTILRKLINDGQIDHQTTLYYLTFEGNYFIQIGGYATKALRAEASDRLEQIEFVPPTLLRCSFRIKFKTIESLDILACNRD